MEDIRIVCPCCRKLIFLVDPETDGNTIIKIKCKICRSVIAVQIKNKEISTERLDQCS